jgi:hypothetical protein
MVLEGHAQQQNKWTRLPSNRAYLGSRAWPHRLTPTLGAQAYGHRYMLAPVQSATFENLLLEALPISTSKVCMHAPLSCATAPRTVLLPCQPAIDTHESTPLDVTSPLQSEHAIMSAPGWCST